MSPMPKGVKTSITESEGYCIGHQIKGDWIEMYQKLESQFNQTPTNAIFKRSKIFGINLFLLTLIFCANKPY